MVFAREFLLDTKKTGGWAIAVSTLVLCAANITMILMYIGLVWASAFGTSDERFGTFAVWRGVAEVKASGTL
jgi:hypothetical protein